MSCCHYHGKLIFTPNVVDPVHRASMSSALRTADLLLGAAFPKFFFSTFKFEMQLPMLHSMVSAVCNVLVIRLV